jgi:hypothetical protein
MTFIIWRDGNRNREYYRLFAISAMPAGPSCYNLGATWDNGRLTPNGHKKYF